MGGIKKDMVFKKVSLSFIFVLSTIFLSILLNPESTRINPNARTYFITVYADMDTYLNDCAPGRNYGGIPLLELGKYQVGDYTCSHTCLFKFDISEISADASIRNAYVKLRLKEGGGTRIKIERITSPWEEERVTWNTKPSGIEILDTIVGAAPGEVSIDVTDLVRGWFRNDFPNFGLMITPASENSRSVFYSREHGGELYDPNLEISYESDIAPSSKPGPTTPPSDTTPPQVRIDFTPPGHIDPADTVTIRATANDNAGLQRIEINIDGESKERWTSSEPGDTSESIDYRDNFALGRHIVFVQVWDQAGNLGSETAAFIVGTGSVPSIDIACAPQEVFPNDGTELEVTVTASDPEGIQKLKVGVGAGFGSPDSYPQFGTIVAIDPVQTNVTRIVKFNNLHIPVPTGDPLITAADAKQIIIAAQSQDAEQIWSETASMRIKVTRPYQWDYGVPYHNPSRDQLPWQVMEDTFGWDETHNCGPSGDVCWRTAYARMVYRDVKDLARDGECFGMSAYSVIHAKPFGTEQGISMDDAFTHAGRDHFLRPEAYVDMTRGWGQDSVQRSIERFHAAQFSDQVLDVLVTQYMDQYMDQHIGSFIDEQLPRLRDDLERGKPGLLCLTRDMGLGTAGHCVVPWYIREMPNGWRIYVYDPNREGASRVPYGDYENYDHYPYIHVQKRASQYTHGQRFSFYFSSSDHWRGFLTYVPFDAGLKNDYDEPDGLEWFVILFASTDAEAYVEDASGNKTGVIDGKLIVNIRDSAPIFLPNLPPGRQLYCLPQKDMYKIHVQGKSSGEYNCWIKGKDSFCSISDKSCIRGKEDVISFEKLKDRAGYSLHLRSDAGDIDFDIVNSLKFGNVTREYELESIVLASSGDIHLYVDEKDKNLVALNDTSSLTNADLILRSTESDTHAKETIALTPREQVKIIGNWKDLGKTSLRIEKERLEPTGKIEEAKPLREARKEVSAKPLRPTQMKRKQTVTGTPARTIPIIPLAEHESTEWTNGNVALSFPGNESDSRGFACYRMNVLLEDDKTYSKVLETHPEWRNAHGLIVGIFKIRDLPDQATFRTKVGFLKGANNSDGVQFKVFVRRDPSFYAANSSYYDGKLDDLAIDLSRYAGQDIELVLQAHVLNNSAQDWAVWVDPRIEW